MGRFSDTYNACERLFWKHYKTCLVEGNPEPRKWAALTPADKAEIVRLYDAGTHTRPQIATAMGRSLGTIDHVLKLLRPRKPKIKCIQPCNTTSPKAS